MTNCLKKTHFLAGMLIFGTLTAITMKMQLVMTCVGWGKVLHTFDKPFFQSIAMFLAMALALPISGIGNAISRRRKQGNTDSEKASLILPPSAVNPEEGQIQTSTNFGNPKKKSWKNSPIVIAVPAIFDLIASTMMTYGLIFLSVSVFQMLRGSMVIWSTVLTRVFLPGRRIKGYQMLGVFTCFIALCMVGAAGIFQPQPNMVVSFSQTAIGVALVIGSQMIQAGQLVTEEFLLRDLDMSAMSVVGFEGVWGFIAMVVLACPLAYVVPGADFSSMPHNSLENTLDSFICLVSSYPLIIAVIAFCIAVLAYNCYGMLITDSFSAIDRTIFEAVRTSCIWIVQLIVQLIIPGSPYGEIWSRWSWLELGGFVLLFISTLVYNAILKVPIFEYPQKENKQENETDR